MSQPPLYPLRFEPIYQYRLWGGRRLANLLTAPLPGDGPIGEAWVLSDREDHPSRVADGPLKGQTIGQVLEQFPEQLMGKFAGRFRRFPLLLKFLDVREMLSVQVHPGVNSGDAATAKTEAWVVLEAGTKSRIYAGLKAGTTEEDLRHALRDGTVADRHRMLPSKAGRCRFPARWNGSLAGRRRRGVRGSAEQRRDVSPVRLEPCRSEDRPAASAPGGSGAGLHRFWTVCGRFGNARGGRRRSPVRRERLFHCDYFWLSRVRGESPFMVGAAGVPRVLVCIDGQGQLNHGGATYEIGKGDVLLLPAVLGACTFQPRGPVNVLEIEIPE